MLARVTAYGLDAPGYIVEPGGPIDEDSATADTTAGQTAATTAGAPATTAAAMPSDDASAPATPGSTADSGTSSTNTQEAGVDEGDVSETDGRYVYSLIDGHLRSVDLQSPKVVSNIDEATPQPQMILYGSRLLVVGQDFVSGDQDTVSSLYAINDGVLSLLKRTHLEGTLLATRSIDGRARIVVKLPFASHLAFVQPRDGSTDSTDAALAQNKQVINDATADQLLPRAYDEGPTGGTGSVHQVLDCAQVGRPEQFSGFNTVWVATVDLTGSDHPLVGSAGVIADAQTVYASTDRLYVTTMAYPESNESKTVPLRNVSATTDVHAFDLTATDGADYVASGTVDGTVLNSYSLSEYQGKLRVATTTNSGGFGNTRESGIHVFSEEGSQLVEVGTLGGLGRTQQIQGVRFFDNLAYVVTFRRIDPLYVVDLTDPTAPVLKGQIEVPGFSTYLQPVGDGMLLTIGAAGRDNATATQLSLFDVSDPAHPKRVSTVAVGQESEATFDPHAFLFWAETGTVVVPRNLNCSQEDSCASAIVAKIVDGKLVKQGELPAWYQIRRTMIASDQLVALSTKGVQIHDLTTLAIVGHVDF